MEDWKKAYKSIHGRTPTKKDITLAPKALKGDSPKSVRRSPRKSLTLKRPIDASFMSPAKKRKLLDFSKPLSNVMNIMIRNDNTDIKRKEEEPESVTSTAEIPATLPVPPFSSLPSSSEINLLSPSKNWAAFRKHASPRKTPLKQPPLILDPKTPSPMKPLGARMVCRNIKFLLNVKTPEKLSTLEEDELEEFADEKPEGARPPHGSTTKKKGNSANFVKVNLRKRNFVKGKKSKFSKAKWLKYKKRV